MFILQKQESSKKTYITAVNIFRNKRRKAVKTQERSLHALCACKRGLSNVVLSLCSK